MELNLLGRGVNTQSNGKIKDLVKIYIKYIDIYVVMLCFYEVLRYLSLIAILTTTKDQTHAPCMGPKTHPFKDPNQPTP